MAKRIILFLAVNVLVYFTISILLGIIGFLFPGLLENFAGGFGPLFVMCVVFGFGGSFISLLMSRWMAKMMMRVKVIDPDRPASGTERDLVQTVYRLSKAAGLSTMPEVGIYASPEVNAFATGPSKSKALVAVSTGLLERMDTGAVEGVLGHEVAHVANGDMVTMTLVQGVVNTFVMFFARVIAWGISQALSRDRDDGGGLSPFVYYMVVFALEMLLMPLGYLVIARFSRWREFRADRGGAQVAGREKMVRALESLARTNDLIDDRQQSLAAFKISNKGKGIMRLFSTHPPIEERIQALKAMAF